MSRKIYTILILTILLIAISGMFATVEADWPFSRVTRDLKDSWFPVVSTHRIDTDDHVYIAWEDTRLATHQIYEEIRRVGTLEVIEDRWVSNTESARFPRIAAAEVDPAGNYDINMLWADETGKLYYRSHFDHDPYSLSTSSELIADNVFGGGLSGPGICDVTVRDWVHVVWIGEEAGAKKIFYRSRQTDGTLNPITTLADDLGPISDSDIRRVYPHIALYPSAELYVVWAQLDGGIWKIYLRVWNGTTGEWGESIYLLGSANQPAIAVDENGYLNIVYYRTQTQEVVYTRYDPSGAPASGPIVLGYSTNLPFPAITFNVNPNNLNPEIDVVWDEGDKIQHAHISIDPSSGDISSSTSTVRAGTGCGYPDVACDSQGKIYVVWQERVPAGGGNDDIYIASKAPNSPPNTPTISEPADGSWTRNTTPTMEFTQSDPDDSEMLRYRIQIDDNQDFSSRVVDYTSGLLPKGTTSFTVGQPVGGGSYSAGGEGQTLTDGLYYWQVMSTDDSGESSAWTISRTFGVDATPPTVSAVPSSSTWTNQDISITLSATDSDGSGIADAKYRWDDLDAKNGTPYTDGYVITLSTEGSHTLYLWGKDKAGNERTWSGTYKLDKTKPSVLAVPSSSTWTNQNISITLSATDSGGSGIAEAKYRWDDLDAKNGTPYTDGYVITLSTEGSHTLYLWGKDKAGNENTWTSGTYKLDKTPPTPNLAEWAIVPYALGVSSIKMVAQVATDTGVATVEYYLDELTGQGHDSGWQSSNSYTDIGLSTNTQYTYTLQYRDGLWNTGSSTGPASAYTLAPTPTNVKAERPLNPDPGPTQSLNLSVDSFHNDSAHTPAYEWVCVTGGGGSSYSRQWTDTGLLPNYWYEYEVRYYNGDGIRTGWVSTGLVCTYAIPPLAPGLSSATKDTIDIEIIDEGNPTTTPYSIRVIVGGTAYYVQGDNRLGSVPVYKNKSSWGTVVYVIGLSSNTKHTVSVDAKNDAGISTGYINSSSVFTRAPEPTGVSATPSDWDKIQLTVDRFPNDSEGQSGYRWECILNPGGGNGSSQREYTDDGLLPNEKYKYSVYYINGDGRPTAVVETQPVYTFAKVPDAPSLSVPLEQLSDRIYITINGNGNPSRTKYSIMVTTTAGGGSIYYVQGSTTTGIYGLGSQQYYTKAEWEWINGKVFLSGLNRNTQYKVSVNAMNGEGVTTVYGNSSSIYTKANVPGTPALTVLSDVSIRVNIKENGNPSWTKYSIKALSGGATYYVKSDRTLQGWSGDPRYIAPYFTRADWGGDNLDVTGLTPNTEYQFSVNAQNGNEIKTDYSTGSSSWTYAPRPQNVYGVGISSTSIQLSCDRFPNDYSVGLSTYHWQRIYPDTKDLTGYKLYPSSCVIIDTGLTVNSPYRYQVWFTNRDGIETARVSTTYVHTLANIPSNLSFSEITNQQIRVSWEANGNPNGTEYQAHCWGTAHYPLGSDVTTDRYSSWTTVKTWLFDGLYPHTTYYFEVKARNYDNIETDFTEPPVSTGTLNTPPTEPILSYPIDDVIVSTAQVTLKAFFRDVADTFGDGVEEGWVHFQLSTSPDVGHNVIHIGTGDWVQSGDSSEWTTPVLFHGRWYWQGKAEDMAGGYSIWSDTESFIIDYAAPYVGYVSISPVTPDSGSGDKAYTNSLTPVLKAMYEDPDGDRGWVDFAISTSSDFGNIIISTRVPTNLGGGKTSTEIDFTLPESLGYGMRFWKVKGEDYLGRPSPDVGYWSFIVNRAPEVPQLVSPGESYTTYITTPTFKAYYFDRDANLSFGEPGTTTNGYIRFQISTSSTDWSGESILADSDWDGPESIGPYAENNSTVTWRVTSPIEKNGKLYFGRLYWRTMARDNHSADSNWNSPRSFTIYNVPPDAPTDLTVSPENPSPDSDLTFSWLFMDKNMGDSQTYYQIQLNTTRDWTDPWWDSSKTANSGSWGSRVEVSYSGSELSLNYDTDYYWQVRVWDQEDSSSTWSTSHFKTSIFQPPEPQGTDNTFSIAIGDLNNDGYLDYVAGNQRYWDGEKWVKGYDRVYLNNQQGNWDEVTFNYDDTTKSVALADVNNDGYLDIIVGNSGSTGETNRVYINNPANPGRNFAVYPSAEAEKSYSIGVGDLDNDGHIDYVAGNCGSPDRVYINQGGIFISSSTLGGNYQTYSVAIGDIDNDGDFDIVAGLHSQGASNIKIYRNDGRANFTEGDIGCNVDVNGVALGDLNGDGYLDIVAGTSGGVKSRVYLNNGAGNFGSVNELSGSEYETTSVALGDIDNDGDLDIVLGNNGEANLIYTNDGGSFSLYEETAEEDPTNSVALGDLDNDGDLDLIAGNSESQPNRIYMSRMSEIRSNGAPSSPTVLNSSFSEGTLTLSWSDVTDDKSSSNQLYYAIRAGKVSGSSDVVSGCYGTPLLGNYIRPKLEDGSLAIKLKWTQGTTCFWQVRTIDSGLSASGWSEEAVYTTYIFSPPAPSGMRGVASSSTTINWSWTDNSSGDRQESGFRLYDPDGPYIPIATLSKDTTYYLEVNLSPNRYYRRYVQAYNIAGSSNSNIDAVWTLANKPAGPGVFEVYSTSITVHWGANGNPDGTKYKCRNVATGEDSGWITATSWTSTGLRANVRYDFEAQAMNHGERMTDWVDLGYAQIGNNPPLVELIFPSDGDSSDTAVPTFVARYTDPDGDNGKVQFKIFNFGETIESRWLDPESGSLVSYETILSNGDWYWQAWAKDEFGSYSLWTSTRILHITPGPNNPPDMPLLTYPDDGATIPDGTPLLKAIYYDPDGDNGWLDFQISNDPNFGNIIDSGSAIATSGFQEVSWEVSPDNVLPEGTYYWRAKANDDKGGSSDWSGKRSLIVEYNPVNRAPSVNLSSPADGSTTYDHTPEFAALFTDPDNDLGRVHFQVSTTNLFNPGDIIFEGWSDYVANGEIATIISDLLVNGTYYWRAMAQDEYGKESSYTGYWTLTIIASIDNTNPTVTLISPEVDAILRTLLPEFKARYNDSDGDMGSIVFQVSATDDFQQVIQGQANNLNDGEEGLWQVEPPSPLSNGIWYWRAKAIDYRGGDSGWSETRRFSIDTTGNQPPRVPVLVSPEDGATEATLWPTFRAYYEDRDRDTGWIYFEVSFQEDIIASGWSGELASGTEASWIPENPLPDQSTVYWRAESFDGRLYSSWSSTRTLHIATPSNNPPNPPELVSPPNGDVTGDFSPLFTAKFTDPDMNGLKLGFEVSSTNDFSIIVDTGYSSELIQDAYGVYWGNWEAENIPQLGEPRTYYWRATAYDSMGGSTQGGQVWKIVIDPGALRNHLPVVYFVSDPRQLKPEEASEKIGIIDTKVEVSDIDGDECVLKVEYSTDNAKTWPKATIMDAQAEFGGLSVDNGGKYQITGIRYTSFGNQINFKWDSKADLPSDLPSAVYDPVYLRVVVFDGLNTDIKEATTSIDLYCQPPDWLISTGRTDTTISFSWEQSTPTKVSGYEIRYSTREDLGNYEKVLIPNRYQTEATVTGLTSNTTYYFNIASFDEFGNIGFKEENKLAVPTEVAQPGPPVVMGLYDKDIGGTGYYTRIEFDASAINNNPPDTLYAIRYIIDYANDKWLQGNGTVAEEPIVVHTVTEWQTGIVNCHTGLEAYTYYKYIIRAYGKMGEYKESSSYGYAWTPPGKPTNVRVSEMPVDAPDYLRVSWDNLTGAATYKLYISTASGGEPVEVITGIGELSSNYDVDGGTPTVVTSIVVTGIDAKEISLSWTKPIGELAPSATYYFKVNGVTTQGSEGPKSDEASGQLHPVIAGYNLYQQNLSIGTTDLFRVTGSTEINNFVDTTVTPNTQYSYTVSAVSSDELEGPLSSSTSAMWTLAAVPGPGWFSDVSTTSIQANWGANGNPDWTKYRVECSTNASFGVIVDSEDWTVNMLSWSASNLSINTEYFFQAQANNEKGTTTDWRVLGSTYTYAVKPDAPTLAITITAERLLAIEVIINPNGNPDWTEYSIEVTYDYGEGPIRKYVQSPDTTTWLATLGDEEKIEPYSVWGGTAGIKNIWSSGVSLIGNTTYTYRVRAWNGNRIPTDFSDPSSLETPPWLPVIWATASDGREVQPGDFLNVDKVTFTIRGSDYYYYKWNTSESDVVTSTNTQLGGPVAVTTLTMDAETSWYLHVLGWNVDIDTPTGQTTFGPITYDIQKPTVTLVVNSGRILRDGEIVGVLPETGMEAKFSKVMRRSSVEEGLELIAVKNNLNEPINEKVSLNFEWDGSTKTVRLTLQSGELNKNYLYRLQVTDRVTDLAGNTVKGERELVFRTIMDYTKKNIIAKKTDERIIVTMEANTLNRDGYLVINTAPLTYQYRVNPDNIVEANKKVTEGYQYPIEGCLWEFNVYDRDGNWMGDGFKFEVEIALPYTDDDGDGMVGDPSIPVKEETLLAFWLNEEHSNWVRVPGSKGDREKNVVTVKVPSFSVYALMGSAVYDLSNAHAYPVPWKPNDGKDETGTEARGITFTNLSTDGVIKIYTISGELVMNYEYKPVDKGKWTWDVKTPNGEKVFSGVYIYYIKNEKEHKTGKLIIIR